MFMKMWHFLRWRKKWYARVCVHSTYLRFFSFSTSFFNILSAAFFLSCVCVCMYVYQTCLASCHNKWIPVLNLYFTNTCCQRIKNYPLNGDELFEINRKLNIVTITLAMSRWVCARTGEQRKQNKKRMRKKSELSSVKIFAEYGFFFLQVIHTHWRWMDGDTHI